MLSGGNQNISLLPDAKADITPVQGGGGRSELQMWQSEPVLISGENKDLLLNTGLLKKFQMRWRQTLGPGISSRRRPREDPHIIIGILNTSEYPTYIVAPLRNNDSVARDVFSWADKTLRSDTEIHIVFMGPFSDKKEKNYIQSCLLTLVTTYPGRAICVSKNEQVIPSLDGLLLHAVPDTSQQLALGFIPKHDTIYQRSSRNLHSLTVETLRIPYSRANDAEDDDHIHTITFHIPKTIEPRSKDYDLQILNGNHMFYSSPGWVSQIFYGTRVSTGGATTPIKSDSISDNAPINKQIKVTLSDNEYDIRDSSNPLVIKEWQQGKFNEEEKRLLSDRGLQYTNEIYSLYLKGLIDDQCSTDIEKSTKPECGIFRYIESNRLYKIAQSKNGKQPVEISSNPIVDSQTLSEQDIIVSAEFNKLTESGKFNPSGMGSIQEKLTKFKNTLDLNNVKQIQNYNSIYITSDIHADVRKLLSLLIKEGIISIPDFDPFSDNIYDTSFIEKISFNKEKILFVILGDLIDGRRPKDPENPAAGNDNVDDKIGNFELLLHTVLFNIRVSAKKKNSDILFTMGNHDFANIIDKNGNAKTLINKYSHSVNYFDLEKTNNLYVALNPFYELSPYIFLILANGIKDEYMCIHAGFHSKGNVNYTNNLKLLQDGIYKEGLSFISQPKGNTIQLVNTILNNDGALWTRDYANGVIDCKDIIGPTVIVGHCPTPLKYGSDRIKSILDKTSVTAPKEIDYTDCNYTTSGTKGCVVADCFNNPEKRPKLIFVDTMMSRCFYNHNNKDRNTEFLLIDTDGKRIARKPVGEKEIVLWSGKPDKTTTGNPAPSAPGKPAPAPSAPGKPAPAPSAPAPEKPTDKPVPAPSAPATEKPTDKPVEKPTDKPVPAPSAPATEKPTDKPVEKPTEKPVEKPTEKPEKPTEKPEKPTEKPEKPTEKPEKPEKPTEKSPEKSDLKKSEIVSEKKVKSDILPSAIPANIPKSRKRTLKSYGPRPNQTENINASGGSRKTVKKRK